MSSLPETAAAQVAVPAAARRFGAAIILRRELRAHLKSFLSWLLPVAGLLVMTISLQPSIAQEGGLLEAKLAAMPEAMRNAFGFGGLDFRRPAAYLATNFLYVTLTASLFGGLLGATLLSKEEALRTVEALLALPVGRAEVLAGKAAALVVYVAAFNAALLGTALVAFQAFVGDTGERGLVAALFLGTALLGLCFGAVGLLLSAVLKDARGAPGLTLGVVLGTYLLGMLSGLSAKADPLRWLSPYKLVEPSGIVQGSGLTAGAVGALLGGAVLALGAAVVLYRRRDIAA
ncbi:MAG TPA: ABC transporter permease subunit [Myxococcaceae bacterium]|nr:ABC transporter permease subunit [Myxococcaceae bacterium]